MWRSAVRWRSKGGSRDEYIISGPSLFISSTGTPSENFLVFSLGVGPDAAARGCKERGSSPPLPSAAPDPGGRCNLDPPRFFSSTVGYHLSLGVFDYDYCSRNDDTGEKF